MVFSLYIVYCPTVNNIIAGSITNSPLIAYRYTLVPYWLLGILFITAITFNIPIKASITYYII